MSFLLDLFARRNLFRISVPQRIKFLSQYCLKGVNNLSLPQIITFRAINEDANTSLYSGLDGFYGYKGRPGIACGQEEVLSAEQFDTLADFALSAGAEFFIWGDDISKNPNLIVYLRSLSSRNLKCRILTIAGINEDFVPFLDNGTIKEVIFSFEVRPEHKRYKNNSAMTELYGHAISGINLLKSHKEKNSSLDYMVSASMIISQYNYFFLDEMTSWANLMGLDSFFIFHSNFVQPSQGANYGGKFFDLFKLSAHSWKKKIFDDAVVDSSVIIPQLKVLNRKKYKIPYFFLPQLKSWQISSYYQDYEFSSGFNKCYSAWYVMNVFENGDMFACANYPDYYLGNIRDESPQELWHGESMTKFRHELSLCDRFHVCTRCCCLYV